MKTLIWFDKKESKFDEIPQKQGVYVIACDCKNGKSCVVYTGQTDDLQRRTNQHWSDSEPNEDLKKAIAKYRGSFKVTYAKVDDSKDLDGIERYLFNHYQPQFTDRTPDAEPIEVILSDSVAKGRVNFKN